LVPVGSTCPAGAAAWAKQKAPAGDASAGLGWLLPVSPMLLFRSYAQ